MGYLAADYPVTNLRGAVLSEQLIVTDNRLSDLQNIAIQKFFIIILNLLARMKLLDYTSVSKSEIEFDKSLPKKFPALFPS